MNRARKALWSALLFLSVLGCGELFFRVYAPVQDRPEIQLDFDAELLWRLPADKLKDPRYQVNSLGMRGPEIAPKNGKLRLLSLGDSSVFGDLVAYDQIFTSVAARQLPTLDAAVGGIPGYSSLQARMWLERIAPTVQPDILLIGTMWSDAAQGGESDAQRQARLEATYGAWKPFTKFLQAPAKYSAFFAWTRDRLHNLLETRQQKVGWITDAGVADPPSPDGKKARVSIEDYPKNLEALVARARELKALPVLLLLPHPLDDQGQDLPPRYQAYRDAMRALAAAEKLPLVDGEAWFEAHPCDPRGFREGTDPATGACTRFADQIHPNAVGHAELGDALVQTLRDDPQLRALLKL
ncbi:MAG TPA: SGNH/GDSL hydrolase family protein [Myxococcota bacterium]|nr:SGNH/GDSL hydrolase family protein [Myxococcota bacterium]